jgi:hypothetical protein
VDAISELGNPDRAVRGVGDLRERVERAQGKAVLALKGPSMSRVTRP